MQTPTPWSPHYSKDHIFLIKVKHKVWSTQQGALPEQQIQSHSRHIPSSNSGGCRISKSGADRLYKTLKKKERKQAEGILPEAELLKKNTNMKNGKEIQNDKTGVP